MEPILPVASVTSLSVKQEMFREAAYHTQVGHYTT